MTPPPAFTQSATVSKCGGSLRVHKATHPFDLINWWLGADPVEVSADGELNIYGKRGPFRHTHCRPCPHKARCTFYFDMTQNIKGGHAGGDGRLREVIFRNAHVPEHMRLPDSRAGAMSCLTGIAARRSVEQRRPVKVSELMRL